MNLVPCNFSLKSYLWFQIELTLCAHSILKSHVWFQPKLHSTQLNYHYKWYKHGRLKLSKLGYSSESLLFSSYVLRGTFEKKLLTTLPPFDNPPAIRFVWTADRLLWYLSQVLHFDKLSQKLSLLPLEIMNL